MMANEASFQSRVYDWVRRAFGHANAMNVQLRTHRFVEEALELAQATGCPREEVLRIVDYVYNRPEGRVHQEIGGVLVTLNALCSSLGWFCDLQGETELHRINTITASDPQFFQNRSNNKPDFTKAT